MCVWHWGGYVKIIPGLPHLQSGGIHTDGSSWAHWRLQGEALSIVKFQHRELLCEGKAPSVEEVPPCREYSFHRGVLHSLGTVSQQSRCGIRMPVSAPTPTPLPTLTQEASLMGMVGRSGLGKGVAYMEWSGATCFECPIPFTDDLPKDKTRVQTSAQNPAGPRAEQSIGSRVRRNQNKDQKRVCSLRMQLTSQWGAFIFRGLRGVCYIYIYSRWVCGYIWRYFLKI